MADRRGWWTITFTPDGITPTDLDLEHIGGLVADGFTEGEIVADQTDPAPSTPAPSSTPGEKPLP